MDGTLPLLWIMPLGCTLIAFAFWLVWIHQDRSGSSGLACIGFALATLVTVLDLSRLWLPSGLIVIVVPLQWVAVAILAHAFLKRKGARFPVAVLAVVAPVAVAWHFYYFLVEPDLVRRNLMGSIVCGVILAASVVRLRHHRENRLDRAIVLTLGSLATFYIVRMAAWIDAGPVASEHWLGSFPMLTLYFGNTLAGLAIALLLMLAIGTDLIAYQTRETRRDALTGIGNRRAFDDAIAADAKGDTRFAAAIMLDLDHFKAINDRYGHAMGDTVLIAAAQALEAGPGQQAVLARVGGEEFALLIPLDRRIAAPTVALVAQSTIAALRVEGMDMPLTASTGLALRLMHEDLRDTLRRADLALYRAKSEGRNRLVMADDAMASQAVG